MERDISQLGFFGDITGTDLLLGTNTSVSATAATSDCVGDGFNNATFPTNVPAHFRRLWGYEQGSQFGPLNCDSAISPNSGTDVIQIKKACRMASTVQDSNRYYASVTSNELEFFNGSSAAPTTLNSRVWEYQHHVYFIKDDSGIPILVKKH
ncbi:hypothetical protein BCS62_01640 [Vibrio cyclitrophicus]